MIMYYITHCLLLQCPINTLQLLVRLSTNNDGQQVTTVLLRDAIEGTDFCFNPPGQVPVSLMDPW